MPAQKVILLIEDESPAVYAIEKYFTNAGYKILTTFSAQEGLKTALEAHPDIIILDILMPSQSGLEILDELRKDEWGKNAKVIVFSNVSSEDYKATARKYGVENYLVKTETSLKDLEDIIQKVLAAHEP